ncbi:MAG: 5'-methylthioadenosine/adenosylhomocysteine nucleosidase [candidate division WOR-3 bacterium]|nr:MAG: 5'-methylthioadenosine/adenosylhomocysteine nucleosidase [candidate division WOR-3 bacterium]
MIVMFLILLSVQHEGVIGIMGAMDVELRLIDESMNVESIDTIGGKTYKRGKICGIPCVTVRAGIGKVAAAHTAQTLILRYGVDYMIFTGVAGGINPGLRIGDIVISTDVVHHDFGQVFPDSFVPFDTVGFGADSMLVALAEEAAAGLRFAPVPEGIRGEAGLPSVVLGRIATGDQFISSEEKRAWIERTFNAECVEMEGAAVAQICEVNGVPFVIIRSLSDLANEDADVDFEAFVFYAAKNSSMLVKGILEILSR